MYIWTFYVRWKKSRRKDIFCGRCKNKQLRCSKMTLHEKQFCLFYTGCRKCLFFAKLFCANIERSYIHQKKIVWILLLFLNSVKIHFFAMGASRPTSQNTVSVKAQLLEVSTHINNLVRNEHYFQLHKGTTNQENLSLNLFPVTGFLVVVPTATPGYNW